MMRMMWCDGTTVASVICEVVCTVRQAQQFSAVLLRQEQSHTLWKGDSESQIDCNGANVEQW